MKDMTAAFAYDLKDLTPDQWMERVDTICEEFGHFEPIGPEHSALFIDAGRTLLVSFESSPTIQSRNDGAAPLGWGFAKRNGWSSLTLMAEKSVDWYRHPAIYGYFDRMIDDGFFDDFDQVLFYGAGCAGYAAAALSVSSPNARVLAIQPQATLEVARTRWDRRFPESRRIDFTTRFGYAPDMTETARDVYVIHDPSIIEDAMHAQMFDRANSTHFTCPFIGPKAERSFQSMDTLTDLIETAMNGTLTHQTYALLWRERQSYMPYLRTLFHRLEMEDNHPRLLARLCLKADPNRSRPLFTKMLEELEEQGVSI